MKKDWIVKKVFKSWKMLKKTLKKLKCLKKIFEKIGKNQKKSEKNWKKLSEIIRKLINNSCIYDILAIFDQSWKKIEDKNVL